MLAGVFRIASYVPCIEIRINAPHPHSKIAANIGNIAIKPGARNCTYFSPESSVTNCPNPNPIARMTIHGSRPIPRDSVFQILKKTSRCRFQTYKLLIDMFGFNEIRFIRVTFVRSIVKKHLRDSLYVNCSCSKF